MKRPVYLLIFVISVIVGLSLAQISVANQIATTGSELADLQKQVSDYKRDNMVLNEQFLEASSLTNISQKADKLGFVEAKSQVYLNTPLPLALKQ
ncbi:MAG TPA: hypothetical protein VE090_02440 [Methylomirabilota bacterium]|nr:hypothetical protein [Methylomirabilota bacterium]